MHPQAAPRRVENLAFVFQELLTVGERLRSNRQQVADAPSFRAQIWGAVKQADGRIKYKRTKEYERCRRGAPAFEPEACRYGLA